MRNLFSPTQVRVMVAPLAIPPVIILSMSASLASAPDSSVVPERVTLGLLWAWERRRTSQPLADIWTEKINALSTVANYYQNVLRIDIPCQRTFFLLRI